MSRTALSAFVLALLLPAAAHAQAAATWTGDAWVDGRLADINAYSTTYRDAFVDEMARYYRAPRELVRDLLQRGWSAGDVYLACSVALQAGRPCRDVVDARAAAPSPDWPALAQQFGVAAGTPAFHALKRGLVASYDRWARPIAVDAELAAEFPERPVAASKPASTGGGGPPKSKASGTRP